MYSKLWRSGRNLSSYLKMDEVSLIPIKNAIFEKEAKAIIPAGRITGVNETYYKREDWKPVKVSLTSDEIILESKEKKTNIKLNSIFYIDREINFKKARERHTLNFTYMSPEKKEEGILALIKTRSKKSLKRKILKEMMKEAKLYYISPFKIEDEVYDKAKWKTGIHRIKGSKHIQILGEKNQLIAIPRSRIFFVSPGEIRDRNALKIFYEKENQLRVDLISPVNLSLSIVTEYFQNCFLKKDQRIPMLSDRELKILKILNELGENKYALASELSRLCNLELNKLKRALEDLENKKVVEEKDVIISLTEIGKIVGDKKLGFDRFDDEKILEEKDRLDKIAELLSKLEKLKINE